MLHESGIDGALKVYIHSDACINIVHRATPGWNLFLVDCFKLDAWVSAENPVAAAGTQYSLSLIFANPNSF